jgi:hypothetical protein
MRGFTNSQIKHYRAHTNLEQAAVYRLGVNIAERSNGSPSMGINEFFVAGQGADAPSCLPPKT